MEFVQRKAIKKFIVFENISTLPQDIVLEIGWKYFAYLSLSSTRGKRYTNEIEKIAKYIINYEIQRGTDVDLLKRMINLKNLFIFSDIKHLPPLPELVVLDIENADDLIQLPRLPKLRLLTIHRANKLKELPLLPSLERLELGEHVRIEQITEFTNLIKLTLFSDSALPDSMPKLLKLTIGNDSTRLPEEMPSLKYLAFTSAGYIEYIPPLDSLEELYLGYTTFDQLPDLPNLKKLYLDNNESLSLLPEMPKLEILHFGNNTLISTLHNLPNLKKVNLEDNENFDLQELERRFPNIDSFYSIR